MIYYQVVKDGYDYFNGNSAVQGELFTPKERNTLVRYISDEHFKEIEISRKKTFFNFGMRLIKSEYR